MDDEKYIGVLVWCHGGCFGGGNSNYDKALRDHLHHSKIMVMAVEFSTHDFEIAMKDVMTTAKYAENKYPNIPLAFGGVSSGGFLAHMAANEMNKPAALLCPVVKPYDRHSSLPEDLQNRQLKFFHTLEEMKTIQDLLKPPNAPRYVMYATHDERAPERHYNHWLHENRVFFLGQPGGHELCKHPSLVLFTHGLLTLILTPTKLKLYPDAPSWRSHETQDQKDSETDSKCAE